jgi:nucleoside-diphosphate-sugar epimerase
VSDPEGQTPPMGGVVELATTNLALVTGAAGWLGSRLVGALVHGLPECDWMPRLNPQLRVRCLVLPGEDATLIEELGGRVEIVRGDITRAEDCARLCESAAGAVLFHVAGIIHPGRRAEFYSVNVGGTRNVLEAAIAAGVSRAVVMSSNSPCGTNPHPDHVFDEASPYRPYMHYGRSKMLMEQAVADYGQAGKIETVTIRAPWFYGPNQPPRQSLFFRMIRDGKGPIVDGGGNRRSMAYVDNLCQGLILAAAVEAARGRTYWIADAQPYSMSEIIDTVERLLETEFAQKCVHKRMRLPGAVSDVAWVADKMLQSVGLYHQKIHVLSEMNKTIACSVEKARAELGYRPVVALEEGMRRSLKWVWQKQGGLD